MKLDQFGRQVMTSGTNATAFDAEMNAAAYNIIFDGIYEHKIAAIVREICCNANDAHIDAGKMDVPFEIQLPNRFNKVFSVIDHGIGLDDTGVRTVFAAAFKSTKTKSAKLTGGFGIGGKTPFAYTDAFEVVAHYDGVTRTYAALINEDGMPVIELIHEQPTTRGNGVEVRVPVKEQDMDKFYHETMTVASFFKTRPIIHGREDFNLRCNDAFDQFEERGYARMSLFSDSRLYSGHRVYALMNNVIYPYPSSVVRDCESAFFRMLVGDDSIVIPFEDGELKPAAPREMLSMVEGTEEKLTARVNDIVEKVKQEIQDKISAASNWTEALDILDAEVPSLQNSKYSTFTYNGTRLYVYKFKNLGVSVNGLSASVTRTTPAGIYKRSPVYLKRLSYNELCKSSYQKYNSIVLVENDIGLSESGIKTNVNRYIKLHSLSKDMILIREREGEVSKNFVRRLSARIGRDIKHVKLSDIKNEVKKVRVSSNRTATSTKSDETIYGRVVQTSGSVARADNRVYDIKKTLVITSDLVDYDRYFVPSIFGDDIQYVVETANNKNKIKKAGFARYDVVLKQFLQSKKSDIMKMMALDSYFIRADKANPKLRDSSIEKYLQYGDNPECEKVVDKYRDYVRNVDDIVNYIVGRPSDDTTGLLAEWEGHCTDEVKDFVDAIEKVESIYNNLVVSCIMSYGLTSDQEKIIKMVDFCRKNGFNV